eukprot:6214084-Pleurochrysis_carterae.AAC.2
MSGGRAGARLAMDAVLRVDLQTGLPAILRDVLVDTGRTEALRNRSARDFPAHLLRSVVDGVVTLCKHSGKHRTDSGNHPWFPRAVHVLRSPRQRALDADLLRDSPLTVRAVQEKAVQEKAFNGQCAEGDRVQGFCSESVRRASLTYGNGVVLQRKVRRLVMVVVRAGEGTNEASGGSALKGSGWEAEQSANRG